jgi:probable phosphoglycerate mutase
MNVILDILGFVFGAVGVFATAVFLYDRFFPFSTISWRYTEKTVVRMFNRMIQDEFSPTLLVGIGRGGAVLGSLLSGCFGHKPLLVVDRKYVWLDNERSEEVICAFDLQPKYLENVLLIAGGVYSGNTMKRYHDIFRKMGAKTIKRAALVYELGAVTDIEYKGFITSRKNIKLPWMFSDNYIRDDRLKPGDQ